MKNRKRWVAMAVAVMMVSSLPAAAFADTPAGPAAVSGEAVNVDKENAGEPINVAVSKEKATSLARELVNIPKEYTLQGASYSTDLLAGGKRGAWSLDFVKKVNGKHKGSIYARISADSGQLLEFNSYVDDANSKPSYPLKVERSQALEIAKAYINTIAPAYKDQVQYNPDYGVQLLPPLTGEVRHSIRYDRIVNGISYVDNYIELEVDSEGHVVRYSLVWDSTIEFPKVDKMLSLQEANAKLSELAKPVLTYILPYGAQKNTKPALSYGLETMTIQATDGKLLPEMYGSRTEAVSPSPVADKPLGEAPKKGASLTEQGAIAKVTAAFKLPAGAKVTSTSYNEYANERTGRTNANWNISWTIASNNQETGSAYATVDSDTGVIVSFNCYLYGDDTKATVTLEQAKATAIETVKKQLPWAANELYLVEPNKDQYSPEKAAAFDAYYFGFVHKVNGATVSYDRVSVSVDGKTGEVRNFESSLSDYAYPSKAPNLIGDKQATEKWLTYYRTQLTYYLAQQYIWRGQPIPTEKYKVMLAAGEVQANEVEYKTEAQLVYRMVPRLIDEAVFLDAETGSWRNSDTGEVTQLEKPQATDVNGHWAQRQLELMVAYKALDVKDGKVRPNAIVTRGELIKMLVLAMNSGHKPMFAAGDTAARASFNDVATSSSYYVYVESALQQNLIDIGDGTFNPEGKVDREEMAELIVRALGYNTLANYDQLFRIEFKDAAKVEKKGQAAIVVGLGIMTLSNGNFAPEKQVSRAEASAAFFRFLQSRADLQEAPLRN
ncbi:S-layer homology domain-containing protein [Paenibacillus gorillae]|uniref:S-layer homology domain-containing protein n=1 Tax=Paenibacillus gorillae TaxID=1243662 RepID=UPI0004B19BF6|nr:S-layer homology domain-containing protein [Paenibacillus gorillae]